MYREARQYKTLLSPGSLTQTHRVILTLAVTARTSNSRLVFLAEPE